MPANTHDDHCARAAAYKKYAGRTAHRGALTVPKYAAFTIELRARPHMHMDIVNIF